MIQDRTSHSFGGAAKAHHQRWLVLFNCQAMGLANCLSLLCDEIRVEHYDPSAFAAKRDLILANLDRFERILIAPGIDGELTAQLRQRQNVWLLPPIYFGGYHPDICYLAGEGPLSKGPLGHYHSAIAYAAFRCGLDETRALTLFNEETYRNLGYFKRWEVDKQRLLHTYSGFGFDMESAFVRSSRKGPFMHNVNHPKIACLHEVAKVVLARAGLTIIQSEHLPHDNLTYGPVFPVYPEIGARLGVVGSYRFKEGATYELMALRQFLEQSFRIYRANTDVEPSFASFFPALDKAITYVKGTN